MPGAVRALLVDLGNVLVRFDHGITLSRISAVTGVAVERLRPVLFGELEADFDAGRLRPSEFFREAERRLGIGPLPDATWIPAWRDIFEPVPEALAALSRIREGVRTVLVSNTNELHWEGVTRVSDVAQRVHAATLSFRLGAAKPDPRMWAAALGEARVPASAAAYADDRPELVEAARRLGLDAFVVDRPGSLAHELGLRGLLSSR